MHRRDLSLCLAHDKSAANSDSLLAITTIHPHGFPLDVMPTTFHLFAAPFTCVCACVCVRARIGGNNYSQHQRRSQHWEEGHLNSLPFLPWPQPWLTLAMPPELLSHWVLAPFTCVCISSSPAPFPAQIPRPFSPLGILPPEGRKKALWFIVVCFTVDAGPLVFGIQREALALFSPF